MKACFSPLWFQGYQYILSPNWFAKIIFFLTILVPGLPIWVSSFSPYRFKGCQYWFSASPRYDSRVTNINFAFAQIGSRVAKISLLIFPYWFQSCWHQFSTSHHIGIGATNSISYGVYGVGDMDFFILPIMVPGLPKLFFDPHYIDSRVAKIYTLLLVIMVMGLP